MQDGTKASFEATIMPPRGLKFTRDYFSKLTLEQASKELLPKILPDGSLRKWSFEATVSPARTLLLNSWDVIFSERDLEPFDSSALKKAHEEGKCSIALRYITPQGKMEETLVPFAKVSTGIGQCCISSDLGIIDASL
jgi:hypothetical protein